MRTGHKPDSKKKWYITIGKNNPPDESDIIEKKDYRKNGGSNYVSWGSDLQ